MKDNTRHKPDDNSALNDEPVDLYEHLVKSPDETAAIFVTGEPMEEAGIYAGDLLVVDRSIRPRAGDVVIEDRADGLTVTTYRGALRLATVNDAPPPEVWGVVTFTIRKLREEGGAR